MSWRPSAYMEQMWWAWDVQDWRHTCRWIRGWPRKLDTTHIWGKPSHLCHCGADERCKETSCSLDSAEKFCFILVEYSNTQTLWAAELYGGNKSTIPCARSHPYINLSGTASLEPSHVWSTPWPGCPLSAVRPAPPQTPNLHAVGLAGQADTQGFCVFTKLD